MGSNRKQPFGYKMEFGRVVENPAESHEVCCIFTAYQQGASFQKLAEAMREKGVSYDQDKPWNKNMIARILADIRYMGTDGYPQIIPQAQFYAVTEKRSRKSMPNQCTEAQQLLRRLSTGEVTPEIESEVIRLLDRLIRDPSIIQIPSRKSVTSSTIAELEDKRDELLRAMPVDECQAKQISFALAAARYEAIGSEEYETQRLLRLFQNSGSCGEPTAQLIKQAIVSVMIDGNGKVRIRLKNNQIVE